LSKAIKACYKVNKFTAIAIKQMSNFSNAQLPLSTFSATNQGKGTSRQVCVVQSEKNNNRKQKSLRANSYEFRSQIIIFGTAALTINVVITT
jgi:hypothetical protein